jgi:DNA repair and recombination protein RAD52
MFSDFTKKALAQPMLEKNVSKRKGPSGYELNYIEGWFAMDEANRIFGFDGWSSETLLMDCVSDDIKCISYIAKVRISCSNVVREGWGAGHGRAPKKGFITIGELHESAVKEAETDARKRALMTFGKPLGLACYDSSGDSFQEMSNGPSPEEIFNLGSAAISGCLDLAALEKVSKRLQDRHKDGSLEPQHHQILLQQLLDKEQQIVQSQIV